MSKTTSAGETLAQNILDRLDQLMTEALEATKPLEVEPYRGQLFELFVLAEGADLLGEEAEPDLSADGVCRLLAERWGLADAARSSFEQQTKLSPDQLARMRLLWSVMRMWMEWTYAWQRWPEFHGEAAAEPDEVE